MILTVLRVSWISLRRDRIAQALCFVLPVAFFSIFAFVLGNMGGSRTEPVQVAVADLDRSEASRRIVDALRRDASLRVTLMAAGTEGRGGPRDEALARVSNGKVPVAVVIPAGFGETFGEFGSGGARVEVLADTADPIAPQMIAGLLQGAVMTAAPDLFIESGMRTLERYGGPLSSAQRAAFEFFLPTLRASTQPASRASARGSADNRPSRSGPSFRGLLDVDVVDVLGKDSRKVPAMAYYAAGTAVMFLLFSAAGAGGSLLEEQESGTIERVLASRLGMSRLILGKWLFLAGVGFVQVTIMFLWGWLVFGLDLPGHVPGFLAMSIVTAAAAAAFGLVIAAACKTRAQLSGVSTVVILIMSAVGGSMFPRFIMPPVMRTAGLFTFNGWALDGYQKVFWYDKTVPELWPQLGVLAGLTVAFLAGARALARRWESA